MEALTGDRAADEEAQTKPLVSAGMEAPPPGWDAETAARLSLEENPYE